MKPEQSETIELFPPPTVVMVTSRPGVEQRNNMADMTEVITQTQVYGI